VSREGAAATTTLGVVVAAAGRGLRLGAGRPKQYLEIAGRPLLEWTILALCASPRVGSVVVACEEEGVPFWGQRLSRLGSAPLAVTPGGDCRALSVRNGLGLLLERGNPELVAVHDGARPGFSPALMDALAARLLQADRPAGVVPGLVPADTIKETDGSGSVLRTLERSRLCAVQTPQLFRREALRRSYAQAEDVLRVATDDAALLEGLGERVVTIPGEVENFKVTTSADLEAMEQILLVRRWAVRGEA